MGFARARARAQTGSLLALVFTNANAGCALVHAVLKVGRGEGNYDYDGAQKWDATAKICTDVS